MAEGLMSIDDTDEIRARYGYRAIIVVGVRDDGTVDVMSHALDPDDAHIIGDYAQAQFGSFLPRAPFQTWFGWGNGGRPKAFSASQIDSLSAASASYYEANTHPDAEPTP